MPIVLNGTTGITTPTYNGSTTAEYLVPVTGFKNRIINGDMTIDQRNAGASVTPTTNFTYTLDRWVAGLIQASKFSVQQSSVAPAGFSNSLLVTSLSSYSVASTDYFNINQFIEGFNWADLGFGTANASTVTLSFWVRSSLTGTFGGVLGNAAGSRTYPFTYTISAANTWEQKSVTIAGDTSGTWVGATNGIGARLWINLGAGATFSGTAGAWSSSNLTAPTGATSVVGTNGATFYITGVQLEVGSNATSFDYLPYGTELALCQRYYYKITPTSDVSFSLGFGRDTTRCIGFIAFPTTMRTAPTALEQSGTASHYAQVNMASGGESVCSSVPTLGARTVASSTFNFFFSSGITIGSSGLLTSNNAAGFLAWSAEL